jgi:hypothetical protein
MSGKNQKPIDILPLKVLTNFIASPEAEAIRKWIL